MPDFSIESDHSNLVCGIDEAGRAPLAGPVTASCVYVPKAKRNLSFWTEVKDSKKLSQKKKDYLFDEIKKHCIYGIATASHAEIDQINIHHATLLAMSRAYDVMHKMLSQAALPETLPKQSSLFINESSNDLSNANSFTKKTIYRDNFLCLIDGKFAPKLTCKTQTIVKGDNLSSSIAAASILAKVTRDRYMTQLHEKHPFYGWNTNAGYPTPTHKQALIKYGITEHHRRSFAPVREALALAS